MAITTINTGTNPNDGSGDSIRAAFIKANDNFTYLQSIIGNLALNGTTGLIVNGPVRISSTGAALLTGTFRIRATSADPYYDVATTNEQFNGGTVAGVTNFTNTTESSSITTGAVTVAGGLGVAGQATMGTAVVLGNLNVNNVNLTAAGQFTLPDGSPFAFDVFANAALQATSLATLTANAALQEANLAVMVANASAQQSSLDTIRANIGAFGLYANANVGTLYLGNISTNANLGAYQTWANAVIIPLDSNVAVYQATTNANVGTLYLGNISTNANLGAYQTWANANASVQQTQIDSKSPTNNPTFTGIPAADTAVPGTNTTQLATTAFVFEANAGLGSNVSANIGQLRYDLITNYALLVGPQFTGTATSDTTAAAGSNNNQIANTSFVFEANTGSIAFLLDQLTANTETINSNVGTLYLGNISTNANVGTLYLGNISTQANIGAYQTWANANLSIGNISFQTLDANVGAYQTWANANLSIGNISFQTLDANVGLQSINPVFTGQSLSITAGNVVAFGGNTAVWRTIDPVNNTQVPATGTGAVGDIPGIIAYDPNTTTLLICTKQYDNSSTIWANIILTPFV